MIAEAEKETDNEVEGKREVDAFGVLRSFWDSRSTEEKTLSILFAHLGWSENKKCKELGNEFYGQWENEIVGHIERASGEDGEKILLGIVLGLIAGQE